MARQTAPDRRGVALPLTMLALVAIGLLVAGIFLLARLEQRAGRQVAASMASDAAAEAGLARVMVVADSIRIDTLPLHRMTEIATGALGGGAHFIDSLFRLSDHGFLVLATGAETDPSGNPIARSVHGRFTLLDGPSFAAAGTITSTGPVLFDGTSSVEGGDLPPSGLLGTCPISGASVAAMADSLGQATFGSGCPSGNCLHGSPPALTDSSLSRQALEQFGPWPWSALVSAADLHLGGVLSGQRPVIDSTTGTCDRAAGDNWGEPDDPSSPCFGYLPIVALAPGSRVAAGRGQGVLVAEGDLEIGDGFEFVGPIVVLGRLRVSGTGVRLRGAIRLLHPSTDTAVIAAGSIGFSRCALTRVEAAHRRLRPLPERGWSMF